METKYIVKVDDNFHYTDETERYDAGVYSTLGEAVKKCEEITIDSLKNLYSEKMGAGRLSD